MMKKIFALILALTLVMCLAACSSSTEEEETVSDGDAVYVDVEGEIVPMEPEDGEASEEVEETVVEATSSSSDLHTSAATPPASSTDAETSSDYDTAVGYIGEPVEALYEAIGEPTGGTQYATSCLEEGAEDGMLFYDDFYVWSLRTEDGETVYDVYLLDED